MGESEGGMGTEEVSINHFIGTQTAARQILLCCGRPSPLRNLVQQRVQRVLDHHLCRVQFMQAFRTFRHKSTVDGVMIRLASSTSRKSRLRRTSRHDLRKSIAQDGCVRRVCSVATLRNSAKNAPFIVSGRHRTMMPDKGRDSRTKTKHKIAVKIQT